MIARFSSFETRRWLVALTLAAGLVVLQIVHAARVTGSEAATDRDRTTVRAEVPEVELLTYPGALRSITHGTGSFVRRPLGYEPAPASLAAVPA